MVQMDARPAGFGDACAMASTPAADVKEHQKSYQFIIDVPGLGAGDIKVQLEDDIVLVVSGERKRKVEEKGTKHLRMDRKMGKFVWKFHLPKNANPAAVSAVCKNGLLTVTVKKLPPVGKKKHRTVPVLQIAGGHVDFNLLKLDWAKFFEG